MKPKIYRLDGLWFCMGNHAIGWGRDQVEAFAMWLRNNELLQRIAAVGLALDTVSNVGITRH